MVTTADVDRFYDDDESNARFEKVRTRTVRRMPVGAHSASLRRAHRRTRRLPRRISCQLNGAHRRFTNKFDCQR